MPPVWRSVRRRYLVQLVVAGLAQAVLAGVAAHSLARALHHGSRSGVLVLCVFLGVAAISVGMLRVAERVLAERLSQDYVHEIRMALLRRIIVDGRVRSLGVAITRTSNDLTAVKNWVALGIAPLVVGIPLLVGIAGALAVLGPTLAVGLLVPVAVFVAVMIALTGPTFARSRQVRTVRGRLSGHIGDAALGMRAVRSAGGVERELGRLERLSRELVAAQVERARFAGFMRGAAAAGTGLATVGVVVASASTAAPPSTVAAALTLVGFATTPVNDLGRVAEYRQAYRAARRIIAPELASAPEHSTPRTTGAVAAGHVDDGLLIAYDLRLPDGSPLPTLVAAPGDRVVLDLGDRYLESALLEQFAGLAEVLPGRLIISGVDLALANDRERRRLVGYAAQGMLLPRGSITRAARYRMPTASDREVATLLDRAGLASRLNELPKAGQTLLVHGGAPLGVSDRARLTLARALLGNPPLLVLDRIDNDLGPAARQDLRNLLATYPGIVLFAGDDPDAIAADVRPWTRRTTDAAEQSSTEDATHAPTVFVKHAHGGDRGG